MRLLKYKNLSRRQLLATAVGASAVNTLWPFIPRLEAMEAEAQANIHRYSYWFEPTNPGSMAVKGSFPASAGALNFRQNWTAFNDEKIVNDLILLRNVSRPNGDGGQGPHPNGVAGISGWKGGGKGKYNAKCTSLDQVLSKKYAPETIVGDIRAGYGNDNGKDGAYDVSSSIIDGKPIARPQTPEALYNQYFKDLNLGGGGGGNSAASKTIQRKLSSLDFVASALGRLQNRISHFDREKLQHHQTTIRSIETQLENIRDNSGDFSSCEIVAPDPNGGVGTDKAYPVQSALMAAALACNVTRVAGAYYGSAAQRITYSHLPGYSGGGAGYHKATHGKHSGGTYINNVAKFRTEEVARYLKMLKDYKEPDGSSVLDNTIFYMSADVIYKHDSKSDVMCLLAGGKDRFKGHGKMISVNAKSNDILTSIAHFMGHEVDKFGDPQFGNGTLPNNVFS